MKKEFNYDNERYLIKFMPNAFCNDVYSGGYVDLYIFKRKLCFWWKIIVGDCVLIKNTDESPINVAIELIQKNKENHNKKSKINIDKALRVVYNTIKERKKGFDKYEN